MPTVAILGLGSMGARHARNALAAHCRVIAYDPDQSRSPALVASRVDSFTEVLVAQPDLAIIASPVAVHAEQFWALWDQTRAHVLVEKPLALSVEQFWATRKLTGLGLAPSARGYVMGYNLRFHEGLRQVRDIILTRLGTVTRARLWLACDRDTWPGHYYGATLLECSHELDLARWFFGPATVTRASTWANERRWSLRLQQGRCATHVQIIDDASDTYDRGGWASGTGGTVQWSWHAPSGRFRVDGSGPEWSTWSRCKVMAEGTYVEELRAALAGLRGEGFSGASLGDGLAVLDLVDIACREAATHHAYDDARAGRPSESDSESAAF